MEQRALRTYGVEAVRSVGGSGGGGAEAGQTNVVRAFAKPVVGAQLIATICEIRRERGKFMPAGLFGEPAWDILLQLYAAHLDGERLSITQLTQRSRIPATTALRFVTILTEAGLTRRSDDPLDLRRVIVTLALAGQDAMDNFFAASGARSVFL